MAIGDSSLPEIRFSDTLPYTEEANGNVTFHLELTETSAQPITVFFRAFEGTAEDRSDFVSRDPFPDVQVTFAAGFDSASFTVHVVEDLRSEPDEFYFVELFDPRGATFGGRNHSLRATGWLLDDDPDGGQPAIAVTAPVVLEGKGVARFTISLSEPSDTDTNTDISFATVSGTAIAGRDFKAKARSVTIDAGETTATVDVALRNDPEREAAETFGLAVKASDGRTAFARATLLDDEGSPCVSVEGIDRIEGSAYQKVALRLSEASSRPVTVEFDTVNGTALGGEDYISQDTTVTFEANRTTATHRVYLSPDSAAEEESDEFFYVALSNPEGGRFGPGDLAPRAIVWIRDDDAGTEKRALAVGDIKVAEDAGHANFTISLSRPLEDDLVIRYKTQKDQAGAKDFHSDKGKVTVAAGATEAVVSIKLKDGRKDEGEETFRLKLTGFDRDDFAPSGHDTLATARIVDDDGRGRLVSEADGLI